MKWSFEKQKFRGCFIYKIVYKSDKEFSIRELCSDMSHRSVVYRVPVQRFSNEVWQWRHDIVDIVVSARRKQLLAASRPNPFSTTGFICFTGYSVVASGGGR